jgi:hypothetical protein
LPPSSQRWRSCLAQRALPGVQEPVHAPCWQTNGQLSSGSVEPSSLQRTTALSAHCTEPPAQGGGGALAVAPADRPEEREPLAPVDLEPPAPDIGPALELEPPAVRGASRLPPSPLLTRASEIHTPALQRSPSGHWSPAPVSQADRHRPPTQRVRAGQFALVRQALSCSRAHAEPRPISRQLAPSLQSATCVQVSLHKPNTQSCCGSQSTSSLHP